MKTSESVAKISPALVLAMAEMKNVEKGAENPFFHSSYATLPDVLDLVRPVLAKHKLALIQGAEMREGLPVLVSRLLHESGEFIESESGIASVAPGPQPYGSAITYLRRYSLMAFCGVSGKDEDDDGNKAQVATNATAKPGTNKFPPKGTGEKTIEQIIKGLPAPIKDLLKQAGITGIMEAHKAYRSVEGDIDALKQLLEEKIREKK